MDVKLVVLKGTATGREIPVKVPLFLIGRDAECKLRPGSPLVSGRHCAIQVAEGTVTVRDLGSQGGTLVNGVRIEREVRVKDGDILEVGPCAFSLGIKAPPRPAPKPAPPPADEEDIFAAPVSKAAGPASDSFSMVISNFLMGDPEPEDFDEEVTIAGETVTDLKARERASSDTLSDDSPVNRTPVAAPPPAAAPAPSPVTLKKVAPPPPPEPPPAEEPVVEENLDVFL